MFKENQEEEKKFLNGNYYLIPVLVVLCILPFIMRIYIYDSGLEQFAWYPNRNQEVDVFLYYRSIAVIVTGAIMTALLGFAIYKEKKTSMEEIGINRIKQSKWLFPLLGFGLLALISTLFSEYRNYGFSGIYEQFESIWVVLTYCMITVYVFYFVRTKEDIAIFQKGLLFLLVVLGALGLTQLTGNDFFETDLGKSFFIPGKYEALKDQVSFTFSGSGNHQVYLTFYNPNYVGVFTALILPITVMLCVGYKDIKKKIIWGLLSIVTFLCALGSGSKAFLLSLVVIAIIGAVLFVRKNKKYLIAILVAGVVFIGAAGVYMNYVNINIIEYVTTALIPQKTTYLVEDFTIQEDHVTLKYNGNTISMKCEADASGAPYFMAWNENGEQWAFTVDDANTVHFADERLAGLTVKMYGGYEEYTYVGEVQAEGHRYAFSKGNNGYTYMNYTYKVDEIVKAESAIFTDYDKFFSNRGYLWSRSLPLLKQNIILGTGADTFSIVFPQNDYVARTNAGYQDQLITKPHSLYLQFGIQYGVVALICFIAVAVIYAVQAFKICWKSEFKDVHSCLCLGVLLGILGYGIMGISNDSCVALSPLAWAMLGFGFAINMLVKEEAEEI